MGGLTIGPGDSTLTIVLRASRRQLEGTDALGTRPWTAVSGADIVKPAHTCRTTGGRRLGSRPFLMPLRVEPVRDRKLYRLIKEASERSIRRGEVIFRRGDPAADVLLVRKGHVSLRLADSDRSDRTVAVAGPSELFGEEAMIPGARRPYSAVAGGRGSVVPLGGPAVRAILRTSQHTLTTYLEVKERDLRLVRSSVSGSPGPTAKERLAGVIIDLAERLGEPTGGAIRIPHWFTHRELADLAGAHRSTVTTALNDWIWRGVLATRGRSLVVARGGLVELRAQGGADRLSVDRKPHQD